MFHKQLLKRTNEIKEQIILLDAQLKDLPDGNIFCVNNGKYFKWFHTDGKNHTYIPKKKRTYAERLARKKYLTQLKKDLLDEQQAIEAYLRHYNPDIKKTAQQLISAPAYQELLSPYFTSFSQNIQEWIAASYDKNPQYPEHLIHKTASGNLVRSKSEAIIDYCLYTHKIPFRYECALTLGQVTYYPDFTILHPDTGKLFYWEHFGRMDESSYSQKACSKLYHYSTYGIYPSVQLITTFETKDNPLSVELVEKTIQHYFL